MHLRVSNTLKDESYKLKRLLLQIYCKHSYYKFKNYIFAISINENYKNLKSL